MSIKYHFECPVCEYDDKEAGRLADETQIYCGMCAGDSGKDVLLKRWPATSEPSYTCPVCKMTSYNPNDIQHRYCGNCHRFEARSRDELELRRVELMQRVQAMADAAGQDTIDIEVTLLQEIVSIASAIEKMDKES